MNRKESVCRSSRPTVKALRLENSHEDDLEPPGKGVGDVVVDVAA
jgi:hypothetical protein